MSSPDSRYTVGYGKPPVHTRFRKGQSGNPSGKPGPASLARQRFQRALHAALEGETADLKDARPRVNLDAMVRRLTLDAAGGDSAAIKLILSELDKAVAREEPAAARGTMMTETEEEIAEQGTDEPPPLMDYALWCKAHGKK